MGIGGIGMSGIAELLLNLGYRVSGSDIASTDVTRRLMSLGGTIYEQHAAEQISGADVVVTSSAIQMDNPEVRAAISRSIPVIPRAEMLAELMRLKYSIAVAGAHGKTSTTSMLAAVLGAGGLDPTVVIGGKLKSIGTNAVLGKGDFIVAEADESDGSFLKFNPAISVVTNVDLEHVDFYKTIEEIKRVFLSFIDRIPFYGLAVLCLDNRHLQDMIPKIRKRFITYGINPQADFRASNIRFEGTRTFFNVYHGQALMGEIRLNLPGAHNVSNALASIAVGNELEIDFEIIRHALETIDGVGRRLEVKGEFGGVTVIDDYGHHPTEILVTLDAVRQSWPERRMLVVFQPHRYTRTRDLFDEFTRAFYQSDILIVLPVYSAGETEIEGADHKTLVESIILHGHKNVLVAADGREATAFLTDIMQPGDIMLTLGAGNVWHVGEEVLDFLKKNS